MPIPQERKFSNCGLGILKGISPLPLGLNTKASESGENVQRMGNLLTISVRHVIPRVFLKKVFFVVRSVAKIRKNGIFFRLMVLLRSEYYAGSSHPRLF
ncbi:hypothetical protein [Allocoleopsis franciscana]|uniref:hypothetical protein n=1 Tax=Allocoleopsis franciscana TaxID=2886352 RepID=UPI001C1191D5|nr:hypothetical protein [Allocoleopsis franciscana]